MINTQCLRNIMIAASSMAFVACSSSMEDIESKRGQSNVETSEKNGVVTATIDPSRNFDQIVYASGSSEVAETYVRFPLASLNAATEINIGEANEAGSDIVEALYPEAKIVKTSAPVFVGPSTDTLLKSDIELNMPLPISADDFSLASSKGKLAFAYSLYTTDGWVMGIKPLTVADLVGTYVRRDIVGFGYFQILYLKESVEAKEVPSATKPSLKDVKK